MPCAIVHVRVSEEVWVSVVELGQQAEASTHFYPGIPQFQAPREGLPAAGSLQTGIMILAEQLVQFPAWWLHGCPLR